MSDSSDEQQCPRCGEPVDVEQAAEFILGMKPTVDCPSCNALVVVVHGEVTGDFLW